MRFLNAPPIVLQILLAIEGVLHLIAGFFLSIFLTPRLTLGYAIGWLDTVLAVVLLFVAWQLPRFIAERSRIPYLALSAILLVRRLNNVPFIMGVGTRPNPGVGVVVDVVLVVYLWIQVRRLRGAANVTA